MIVDQISNITWNSMEYTIDKFDIIIGNKTTNIHNAKVKNIYLEKDFDELSLPIFIVGISVQEDLYYDIHNNYKNTIFRISISSRKKSNNGGKPTNKSLYLSGDFNVLGIDGTPFTNEKEYNKVRKELADSNGNTMQDLANDHTFILGKKTTISNIKKVKNIIFSSANMSQAITYVLSSSGINNVLMSPLDNTTSYNELVLLPLPLNQQLQYLNSMYGFYKEGSQIFFDFDISYILRNSGKCTAYQRNEIKNVAFVVYKRGNGSESDKGSNIINNTGYINIGTGDNLIITNVSESNDSYIGNNSMILNDNGSMTTAYSKESGSYNVITTTTHNKYYNNEVKVRLKELEGVVSLGVTAIDLKLLTPNKHFTIVSDDSKVSSKLNYPLRLSGYKAIFGRDGDAFTPVVTVTLKKSEG